MALRYQILRKGCFFKAVVGMREPIFGRHIWQGYVSTVSCPFLLRS